MKKVLLFLAMSLFVTVSSVFADDTFVTSTAEIAKIQNQISRVGFKLLNSSGLPNRTVFYYNNAKTINAYSVHSDKRIILYRGMYIMLEDEDQLAAVLGHEIAHSMECSKGIFRGFFKIVNYVSTPRKYEYKSDKLAIDYMVNAGYHPVAMIVMMSKIFPQERYDWCSTHPLSSRRMMEVYEYIYKKYPEYLVNNKYKDNPYYQNFLITSKENREKFQQKVQTNSTKKLHYL